MAHLRCFAAARKLGRLMAMNASMMPIVCLQQTTKRRTLLPISCAAGKSPQRGLRPMGLVPLLLTIKQSYYSMCQMTARLASRWRMVLSKFREPILSSRLTVLLHATMFRLSCLTKDREAAPPLPLSGCAAWDLA